MQMKKRSYYYNKLKRNVLRINNDFHFFIISESILITMRLYLGGLILGLLTCFHLETQGTNQIL